MASISQLPASDELGDVTGGIVRRKPVRERSMSCVTKLLIQGIRGFGPSDEQKAVIEFGRPLTLITGQNGAGKTTIIECLKYVTTGEFPPNSRSGAFVHDPKLANERSIRAMVKLKFQSICGETIICHRMLQSTQKPRKIEQKAVDSSLSKINSAGEKIKITTRCGDINREMIDLLGVSKAILTHVIFCHQEESAWPLSEGKALKAKFDDIFASTRYTKALENFKKIQQDLTGEIRICKAELHHLTKQKEKVDEVKGNLQDAQKKVDNSKAEITRIKNELMPLECRLQELTNKYDEVTQIEKDITMHESSRKELVRSKQSLESQLEHVSSSSKAELREEREQHRGVVERNNTELEEHKRKLERLGRSVDTTKEKLDGLHKEHGRLKTEEQYHKQRVSSRDKDMVSTAAQFSLPGYQAGPFSQSTVTQFLQDFSQHRTEAKKKAEAEKKSHEKKEQEMQERLNQLRTNLAKIEESVGMKTSTIRECRGKVTSITRELAAIGSGSSALEGVEQDLVAAEKELSDYHETVDIVALEEELEVLGQDKQKLNTKAMQLQKELTQQSVYSSARGAVDGLKKQKKEKEDSYQLELGAVEPELLALLGVMPSLEENLTDRLKGVVRGKEREKHTATERHRQAAAKLSRFQAQHEELEKQLREKKARVDALQQEIEEVCGEQASDSYQVMVDTLQQKIDSASENISTVKGSQSFFRKSLEKLHSNHKCPLCMRGFEEKATLDSTIKLITTRLNEAIPRMIPRLNNELHQLQDQQKKLQELKPKIEELSNIRSQELPHRQNALEEKSKVVADVQASIEKEMEAQEKLEGEMEHIRSLEPKVTKVTQLREQLAELGDKIVAEERKLGTLQSGSQRSQHLVNRELTTTQRNAEEVSRKIDNKRQEITESQRAERQLEVRVHSLKEDRLRLQSQLQKRETLISKKNDLTTQIGTLESEVKLESNRVAPVKEKMEGLEGEKAVVSRERGEAEAKIWAELEHLRVTYEGLKHTSETIDRYLKNGKDKSLQDCEEKVQQLSEAVRSKNTEKKDLEGKMATLNKELANAKNKERALEDNLQLISLKEEIEQKMMKVQTLRTALQSMGLDQYDTEYQRLRVDVERLRKDHARAEGHKLGQEDQVRHLKRELQSDLYATTEKRYMEMFIKLKTTEMASKDLVKYYKALDRAITRFHGQKMEEINTIIRELWIKTYKGGDIDRIEIRSDEGASQTDIATIATRRVYNYRVVMIKGSAELDMRGRCSAGQKVLASIIIRLALAETFCLTSGLLALDEPTTNLDRDNVEGLANALTDIVKARSEHQKNFQLIIITHDEAFVELLGHSGYTECFYKVTKSFGETSKIGRYYF